MSDTFEFILDLKIELIGVGQMDIVFVSREDTQFHNIVHEQ